MPDLIIVGLGNPGVAYRRTRHNLGFMVLDVFAAYAGIRVERRRLRSIIGEGIFAKKSLVLAKPRTFMNLSGIAAKALIGYYRVSPLQLLVLSDDLNLPLGKIRLRRAGSDGGHKGLFSIIQELGTTDFPRLRIGIGSPPGGKDAVEYVLEEFAPEELTVIRECINRSVQAIESFVLCGPDETMSAFNA